MNIMLALVGIGCLTIIVALWVLLIADITFLKGYVSRKIKQHFGVEE